MPYLSSTGDATGFNAEKYVRECLKEMIVEAPGENN